MKIYTRTGDAGETGQLGGGRVRKDHPRMEACGTVDELNAALGAASAAGLPPDPARIVARVQHELFALGAQLATPPDKTAPPGAGVTDKQIAQQERDIDALEAALAPLRQFILPGGSPAAAALHLARAVCRRAERRVVQLHDQSPLPETALRYLNRLSDLLFVLARTACAADGSSDIPWQPAQQ